MMNEAQRFQLFEQMHQLPVEHVGWQLQSMLAELESVAKKTKAMSVFSISEEMVGKELHCSLLKRSGELGVLAALHKGASSVDDRESAELFLFFVSCQEAWRIPAYLSMKTAFGNHGWSDGAEFLEGTLLGYSDGQMTSWINAKRRKRIGWLGLTCYFLMSRAQRAKLQILADRCIDPSSMTENVEVFYSTDNLTPKANIQELLPETTHLCRASIKYDFFKKLFARDIYPARKVDFFVSVINADNALELNKSLQSNFQFFGD